MNVLMTAVIDPDPSTAELDRLGDEIAERPRTSTRRLPAFST